jgi:hypothetical protein
VGVVGAERRFGDAQGLLIQGQCFGGAPQVAVGGGQVPQARSDVGMVGADAASVMRRALSFTGSASAACPRSRWARCCSAEIAFLHLKQTVRGPRRALRGESPELARQEAWALLLIHNMTATAAALAGTDPGLIPFTAVLALIRGHVTADTCCRHCGRRPGSPGDPLAGLLAAILALPRHRDGRQRTSGRTTAERRTRHTEEVDYTIDITKSNLPEWDKEPES